MIKCVEETWLTPPRPVARSRWGGLPPFSLAPKRSPCLVALKYPDKGKCPLATDSGRASRRGHGLRIMR
jgi:hypothetical protein